jgi:excinuclease ABC subunit C
VAQEVFKELGIKGVDLLSLAKAGRRGDHRFHIEKSDEKVFHPQHKEPIVLGKQSPLLRFLDRIRDEAHRFAITYHKKVRKRGTIRSVLEEIPGIGKVRQRELLRFFGSAEKIKEATVEELSKALTINYKLARKIHQYFYP